MNDPVMLMVGGRVLERLVIAIGGIVCIWLGYRLFFQAASNARDIMNVEGGGYGVKFKAKSIGPGVFFAFFGALLLGYTIFTRIDIKSEEVRDLAGSVRPAMASSTSDNPEPGKVKKVVTFRGLNDGHTETLPQSVKAANSLLLLWKIQRDTQESTLSRAGYDVFMQATPFLTEFQRAYIDERYGAGTYDTVLDMKQKCDNTDPACEKYRGDPAIKKQMDAVLSDLATGIINK